MERVIKFRGLNANKEWVYGLLLKDTEGSTAYYTKMPYRICWFEDSAHCNQPVITETIGQFTGLLDYKGEEIFEGDIMSPISLEGYSYTVKFEEGEFCLYSKHGRWGSISIMRPTCDKLGIEINVIGNIFEHPELC
jgi:uncharacterized phage protein (TIGR01671 family)